MSLTSRTGAPENRPQTPRVRRLSKAQSAYNKKWGSTMGKLSSHVLDAMHGVPARGVLIELYRLEDGRRERLKQVRTNDDGRCDEPLLAAHEMRVGVYELLFHAGDYFAKRGIPLPNPRFVDQVPI